MAFRNYSGFDRSSTGRVATGGDGKVHKKPLTSNDNPKVLPPPSTGLWVAIGDFWMGPFYLVGSAGSSIKSLRIDLDNVEYHPMFEGAEL